MRWQDSGFNTEDCSRMRIQFRNLKADKQPQALGFGLKLILNLKLCSLKKKGLGSLSTLIGCEQEFSPPLLPGCPWHLFSDACFSASPGRSYLQLFPGLPAEVRSLELQVRFWIFKRNGGMVVECLLTASAPRWFAVISSSGQKDRWFHPMSSSLQRPLLAGRHMSSMTLVTYTTQGRVTKTMCATN